MKIDTKCSREGLQSGWNHQTHGERFASFVSEVLLVDERLKSMTTKSDRAALLDKLSFRQQFFLVFCVCRIKLKVKLPLEQSGERKLVIYKVNQRGMQSEGAC